MIAVSLASRAAEAAGVPARYRYWYGQSGSRHLFTATDLESLPDFDDAVVIAVRGDAVIWAGDLGVFMAVPLTPWMSGADLYVHLLASTIEERRAVAADLRPAECVLKLAA